MSMTREEAIKFAHHAYDMTDIPDVKEFYAIAENALREQEQHRWIPVTERLPEKMKDVLVIRMHGEPDIEFLFYDGTWVGDTEGKQDVTHWMPLPKPPKGE